MSDNQLQYLQQQAARQNIIGGALGGAGLGFSITNSGSSSIINTTTGSYASLDGTYSSSYPFSLPVTNVATCAPTKKSFLQKLRDEIKEWHGDILRAA